MSESQLDSFLRKEFLPLKELPDNPDLIDVRMNTWGVTRADHTNPILKTIGLGPCVAVALYEPDLKIAGLVHMTAPAMTPRWEAPHQDILNMLTAMQRNGVSCDARKNIKAHLVGGWAHDDLAALAKERLHQLGIDQILTDMRTEGVDHHCIALDSRSGDLFKLIKIMQDGMDTLDVMRAMIKVRDGASVTSDHRSLR